MVDGDGAVPCGMDLLTVKGPDVRLLAVCNLAVGDVIGLVDNHVG